VPRPIRTADLLVRSQTIACYVVDKYKRLKRLGGLIRGISAAVEGVIEGVPAGPLGFTERLLSIVCRCSWSCNTPGSRITRSRSRGSYGPRAINWSGTSDLESQSKRRSTEAKRRPNRVLLGRMRRRRYGPPLQFEFKWTYHAQTTGLRGFRVLSGSPATGKWPNAAVATPRSREGPCSGSVANGEGVPRLS
jgi:hypothetical protein